MESKYTVLHLSLAVMSAMQVCLFRQPLTLNEWISDL